MARWRRRKSASRRPVACRDVRRGHNDCLTVCVAYYLGLAPSRVPLFVRYRNWRERLWCFFWRRGLDITCVDYHPRLLANKRKLYLVQGCSPRNRGYRKGKYDHMVIYRGRKRHYDPAVDARFLHGRPKFVWVVRKAA